MSSCSAEQLTTLLDFMSEHRDLARGLLRSADGRLRAKRLWHEVSELLNSLGGSVKSIPQWQKVWADKKHLAKKKSASQRRSVNATGGGPGSEPLAPWETKVLSIMGEGFGAPTTTARVPVIVPIMNFEDEVASYNIEGHADADPQHVEEWVLNSPSHSPHAEQQLRPSPAHLAEPEVDMVPAPVPDQRNTSTRRTRRRRTVPLSVTELLLKQDAEKIALLRGMKDEIQGLAAVVKELVELIKTTSH